MTAGLLMYTLLSGYRERVSRTICIILLMSVSSRSFHGFIMTVRVLLDWLVPILGLEPVTFSTYSMSCCLSRKSMARSVTSLVLSRVAPTGSSSSTVK